MIEDPIYVTQCMYQISEKIGCDRQTDRHTPDPDLSDPILVPMVLFEIRNPKRLLPL